MSKAGMEFQTFVISPNGEGVYLGVIPIQSNYPATMLPVPDVVYIQAYLAPGQGRHKSESTRYSLFTQLSPVIVQTRFGVVQCEVLPVGRDTLYIAPGIGIVRFYCGSSDR